MHAVDGHVVHRVVDMNRSDVVEADAVPERPRLATRQEGEIRDRLISGRRLDVGGQVAGRDRVGPVAGLTSLSVEYEQVEVDVALGSV